MLQKKSFMRTINDLKKYLENLQEEFDYCENKEERMELIIEMGKELKPFPKEQEISKNKVSGCVSNVYIYLESKDGIKIYSTSSSLIVRGYLVILINALNGLKSIDIIKSKELIEEFVKKNGLNTSIVPSRANVIGNIFDKIKEQATKIEK